MFAKPWRSTRRQPGGRCPQVQSGREEIASYEMPARGDLRSCYKTSHKGVKLYSVFPYYHPEANPEVTALARRRTKMYEDEYLKWGIHFTQVTPMCRAIRGWVNGHLLHQPVEELAAAA